MEMPEIFGRISLNSNHATIKHSNAERIAPVDPEKKIKMVKTFCTFCNQIGQRIKMFCERTEIPGGCGRRADDGVTLLSVFFYTISEVN